MLVEYFAHHLNPTVGLVAEIEVSPRWRSVAARLLPKDPLASAGSKKPGPKTRLDLLLTEWARQGLNL
jgi:hypothetical protein